ncbi:MAG: hypothetical protein ACRDGU_08570 [Actinomycetota bacterium]
MQTSDLRQRVQATLIDFVWSQWVQMGVSGSTVRRDRWAADPEALLLFTVHAARRDPRLFDEVLDWLRLNGKLLSVQRLRNLAEADDETPRLIGAALAWARSQNPTLRSRLPIDEAASAGEPKDLFLADGEALLAGTPDPIFLRFGYRRPRAKPSWKSQAPNPLAPINLAFRLRLAFGVGSRSEVLRYLLTTEHPEASTQQIAEATAFAKRNVSDILLGLADAGVVETRQRTNERVYWADRRRWAFLLGVGIRELPDFVDWIRLLTAIRIVLAWLDEDAKVERSDYLRSSEARRLLDRIRPDLLASGVDVADDRSVGTEHWTALEETLERTLRKLRPL